MFLILYVFYILNIYQIYKGRKSLIMHYIKVYTKSKVSLLLSLPKRTLNVIDELVIERLKIITNSWVCTIRGA